MEKLEWTKDYSVGITQFDEQHKKLFSYLNDLYEALDNQKNNQEIVSKTLNDLIVYTFSHFANEESYMKKYSFQMTICDPIMKRLKTDGGNVYG